MQAYQQLVKLIILDPESEALGLDTLSVNHLLRFLAGNGFDVKLAFDSMKDGESWLIENKMWELAGK